MPKKNWTKQQENAINSIDRAILVSAAAGSGKTAVLVERVVQRLICEERPVSADKFLIMTFTKAAAHEMRARIDARLEETLKNVPENINFIKKQQMLLKKAKIGTIHSFCNNLIKENFHILGINPNFRISNEDETAILKERAMEDTLTDFYIENSLDFRDVLDLFATDKDDRKFVEIINQIYDFAISQPHPEKWLENKINELKSGENLWQEVILNHAKNSTDTAENFMAEALKLVNLDKNIQKAWQEAVEGDLEKILELKNALNNLYWDNICEKINFLNFARLKPAKTEDVELKEKIVAKRDFAKDAINKLKEYFCFTDEETSKNREKIAKISKTLLKIIKKFSQNLSELKHKKNCFDFNDLEHLAIKLLINESGTKSEFAKKISENFEEILIDEFQDTNETQNLIFDMISRDRSNLFIVGDVKQSIYRFRKTAPKIFIEKKEKLAHYDENCEHPAAKIILGKNFRSREGILNFVNFIFKKLMSKEAGEIDYTDEEKLVYGANYIESEKKTSAVSLKILNLENNMEKEQAITAEAHFIGEEILKIISSEQKIKIGDREEKASFKDFCILLRSAKGYFDIFLKEFKKMGIPCVCENNENFFETTEVSAILSILQVIDNPLQDIPLFSVLNNPIFGFSLDELVKIRNSEDNTPIYIILKKLAENGDKKIAKFLNKINEYRNLSSACCCAQLVNYIFDDTGYYAAVAAMENPEVRRYNLIAFVDYIKKYEGSVYKTLSGFLNFIEKIKGKKIKFAVKTLNLFNAVKIMTIHKSKGLEFPICILAGCAKNFNFDKNSVLLHPDLGISFKLKNSEGNILYDNLMRKATSLKIRNEAIAEELRILYVALTRAKERLMITASLKDAEKSIKKATSLTSNDKILPFVVNSCSNFLQWLLLCVGREEFNFNVEIIDINPSKEEKKTENTKKIEIISTLFDENVEKLYKLFESRFNFKYPCEKMLNLPLKMASSKLSGAEEWQNHVAQAKPTFISEISVAPADLGNAMHKFLYFVDFNSAIKNLENEFERLRTHNLLTDFEAKIINKNQLKRFFLSDIAKRAAKSENILREYRFSVNLPAKNFFEDVAENSEILVQGAIDLAFEESNEFIILDYKTDKTNNTDELKKCYRSQLLAYKLALESIMNKKVRQTAIYSLFIEEVIEFKF